MNKDEMKKKMDTNAKAKKMIYSIDITRYVDRKNIIRDGGTIAVAEALSGKWIRLNSDGLHIYEEGNEIIVVDIGADRVGCSCDKFLGHDSNVICKHLVALLQKEKDHKMPQLLIESDSCRIIQANLMNLDPPWTVRDRMFFPPEAPTTGPVVVAELPPLDEEVKDVKSDETDPPTEEPKVITRTCDHCGHVISGTDRDTVVRDIAEHRENCPKNPKNEVKPEVPKPEEPNSQEPKEPEIPEHKPEPPKKKKPEATEMLSAKCQFCGKMIKRRREDDLQKAIDDHERTCSKRPTETIEKSKAPSTEVATVEMPTEAQFKTAAVGRIMKNQGSIYKVSGKEVADSAAVSNYAVAAGVSTETTVLEQTAEYARATVRAYKRGRYTEGSVLIRKDAILEKLVIDLAEKNPKWIIGWSNGLPEFDLDKVIHIGDKKKLLGLHIAGTLIDKWTFAARDCETKARRRAQIQMLGADWREDDEVDSEVSEMNIIAKSR